MRQLKFRAWNTSAKQWQTDYSALDCNGNFLVKMSENSFDQSDGVKLIFQQYTGLKDKNGVEIYEGDVIAYTSHTKTLGDVYHRRVVEWHDEVARFSMHKIGKHTSDPKANEYSLFKAEKMQKLEIIGNIYENPELLEKSDV